MPAGKSHFSLIHRYLIPVDLGKRVLIVYTYRPCIYNPYSFTQISMILAPMTDGVWCYSAEGSRFGGKEVNFERRYSEKEHQNRKKNCI